MDEPFRVIRWEEPPPAGNHSMGIGRPGSRYDQLAATLGANPGRWALIREGINPNSAGSLAGVIRRGSAVCFQPRGDFDARVRAVGNVASVYACYLGDGQAAS